MMYRELKVVQYCKKKKKKLQVEWPEMKLETQQRAGNRELRMPC